MKRSATLAARLRDAALAAVLAAACVPAAAEFSGRDVGTSSANFLKLPVGARAAGLGGAYTALATDPTALRWNPAGLAGVARPSVSTMYAAYLADTNYQHLGLAVPLGRDYGVLGADATYLSVGSLQQTGAAGNDQCAFRPYNLAAGVGYAYGAGPWRAGGAARLISSRILDTASTFAFDAGAQLRLGSRLRLGGAVQNLGPGLRFEQRRDPLPATVRLGSAFDISRRWLAALDVAWARDNDPVAHVGGECAFFESADLRWAGRMGYTTLASGVPGLSGLTVGIGGGWRGLELQYAFTAVGELGLTHRVSVGFSWGESRPPEEPPSLERAPRVRERDAPAGAKPPKRRKLGEGRPGKRRPGRTRPPAPVNTDELNLWDEYR